MPHEDVEHLRWTTRERVALTSVALLAVLYLGFEVSEIVRLPRQLAGFFMHGLLASACLLAPTAFIALLLTRGGRAGWALTIGLLLGVVAFVRLWYLIYSTMGV